MCFSCELPVEGLLWAGPPVLISTLSPTPSPEKAGSGLLDLVARISLHEWLENLVWDSGFMASRPQTRPEAGLSHGLSWSGTLVPTFSLGHDLWSSHQVPGSGEWR